MHCHSPYSMKSSYKIEKQDSNFTIPYANHACFSPEVSHDVHSPEKMQIGIRLYLKQLWSVRQIQILGFASLFQEPAALI